MKNKIISLLLTFLLILPPSVWAQTYYSWRQRIHATDCTSLTNGKQADICVDDDTNQAFRCDPDVANTTCDTPSEWKPLTANLVTTPTPCSAGNFPLGIAVNGDSQSCTDVLTQAELIDEDTFSTDSATRPPSQQSTKAYIATQLATQDECSEITNCVPSAITASSSDTLTNKTISADSNTVTNIDAGELKASAFVIEAEGISLNDNDTTWPSSAAVKDYADTQDAAQDECSEITGCVQNAITASSTDTLTNKTINADNNTVSNIDTTEIKAATLVTAAETIAANNNDTTIPTSAAVKAYADSVGGGSETNSLETLTTGILINEVPVGTASGVATYKAIPDCNVAGSALNYEDSTQEWSCRSGFAAGSGINSFQVEDGDGTEVTIDDAKEWKFIGDTGVTINWTDVTPGSDADPFDLTFSLEATLVDILDGTIAEDLVNTANPWADNEVADNITITNISQVQDITATASEINTPLDGALVTLAEFRQLETIGATTISANQWAALGGIAETLSSTELNLLDGITVLSGSNTGDDDVPDAGDFGNATDLDANGALNTDSVSANELDATGVEAELEAVMDLQDMQGAVTDGQVPDTITVSNYVPLSGGSMTGELFIDLLGLEFEPGDTLTDCSTFSATGGGIFYDDSEGKFKKCEEGSLTDLDTTGGTTAFSTLTGGTNTGAAMVVGTGASLSSTGSGTIAATTAAALAANGTNASAGNAILGVDAAGNAEGSFDVLTQAELIDEDNMVSDSAVRPPSQQSVKAYVDTQDAAQDECSEITNCVPSAITASSSDTLTNKLFDANGTGNSVINIESPDISNGTIADVDISDDADIKTGGFGITIDGGGSAITTGVKGYVEVPYACTIQQVKMLADQSGSAVVDIWVDAYANYPPTDADTITASAVPTISTATKSQDATLTGWTTGITAGDIVGFNVDSAATIERLTINVECEKD